MTMPLSCLSHALASGHVSVCVVEHMMRPKRAPDPGGSVALSEGLSTRLVRCRLPEHPRLEGAAAANQRRALLGADVEGDPPAQQYGSVV